MQNYSNIGIPENLNEIFAGFVFRLKNMWIILTSFLTVKSGTEFLDQDNFIALVRLKNVYLPANYQVI